MCSGQAFWGEKGRPVSFRPGKGPPRLSLGEATRQGRKAAWGAQRARHVHNADQHGTFRDRRRHGGSSGPGTHLDISPWSMEFRSGVK